MNVFVDMSMRCVIVVSSNKLEIRASWLPLRNPLLNFGVFVTGASADSFFKRLRSMKKKFGF